MFMAGIGIADMSELALCCIRCHDLSVLYHCTIALLYFGMCCTFILPFLLEAFCSFLNFRY